MKVSKWGNSLAIQVGWTRVEPIGWCLPWNANPALAFDYPQPGESQSPKAASVPKTQALPMAGGRTAA